MHLIIDLKAIFRALMSLNLVQNLVIFIELLLKSRIVNSTVEASHCQRIALRSTLQGGVQSPLVWNLPINSLLKLNLALSIVLDWRREFGLFINPTNTDMNIFTRRYAGLEFICSLTADFNSNIVHSRLTKLCRHFLQLPL